MSLNHWHVDRRAPAFSLIEMVAVMGVLVMLSVAGVSLLHGTGSQSRKAGIDMLAGVIEQARAAAITSRSYVVLAVAEPGDLPTGDECCRLGMFRVETWPDAITDTVNGVLMTRWRSFDTGIALIGGNVDGVDNLMDRTKLTISSGTAMPRILTVHALVFNARGGLHYPPGSLPVVMRLAEGCYRGGKATPYRRGEAAGISESRLKIGRVTSHSYRSDG